MPTYTTEPSWRSYWVPLDLHPEMFIFYNPSPENPHLTLKQFGIFLNFYLNQHSIKKMDYLIFERYTLEIVFLSDQVKRVKGKKQTYQKHTVLVGR